MPGVMGIGGLRVPALVGGGGGKTGLTNLLLDQFTTAQAAPLTTPRTCEPGPGSLTIVDTVNMMSIAGGVLVINGTPGASNGVIATAIHARKAGRAFLIEKMQRTTVTTSVKVGLSTTTLAGSDHDYGLDYNAPTQVRVKLATAVVQVITLGSGNHYFAFVMRNPGAFFLGRNGDSGAYSLLWVYNGGTADEYSKLSLNNGGAVNFQVDNWRVVDEFPAPWNTQYGIATARVATTADAQTLTGTADAFNEHTITAATGVTQEFMVRRTDDDNCWIVRMDQGGSTIKLIEKNAGVETERSSAAQTWTNGTAYRVVVKCTGQTIVVIVQQGASTVATKNTYTTASFNQTATGLKVSHAGTELVTYPATFTMPEGVA